MSAGSREAIVDYWPPNTDLLTCLATSVLLTEQRQFQPLSGLMQPFGYDRLIQRFGYFVTLSDAKSKSKA